MKIIKGDKKCKNCGNLRDGTYNELFKSCYHKRYYEGRKDDINKWFREYTKERYCKESQFRLKLTCRNRTNNKHKKGICNYCSSKDNLEFHHFKYKLSLERKDFIVLCRDCHFKLHGKMKR